MNSKKCSRCRQQIPKDRFSKSIRNTDGLDNYCKPCRREYYLSRRVLKLEPREENQCRKCMAFFDYNVKTYCKDCRRAIGAGANLKKYGLTVDDYIKMEQDRNGLCDACGKPEESRRRLTVDHDHNCCPGNESCGECIRGLLCFRCNTALGLIKDDIATLRSMIKYLG